MAKSELPEAKLHKPSGRYRARKQIFGTRLEGWGSTPSEAQADLARKALQLANSQAPEKLTLNWFLDHPHAAIRNAKRGRNREHIDWALTHIRARWGDRDPSTITRTEAQVWLNSLRLALNSRRHILRHARAIWEILIDDEMVVRNPFRNVVLAAPEDRHDPVLGVRPIDVLTAAEMRALIVGSRAYAAHAGIVICGLLGLRLGECRGLRPKHFDIIGSVLDVPGTKTGASQRSLYLPSRVARELRDERMPFVPLSDSSANKAIRRASLLVIGREIHHHTLRHTFATGLEQLGCPEDVRAKLLGHGKRSITGHYSHVQAKEYRRWMVLWCRSVYSAVGEKWGSDSAGKTA